MVCTSQRMSTSRHVAGSGVSEKGRSGLNLHFLSKEKKNPDSGFDPTNKKKTSTMELSSLTTPKNPEGFSTLGSVLLQLCTGCKSTEPRSGQEGVQTLLGGPSSTCQGE
ncbi:hypothetical protein IscW_ISCW020055 [Ixodes scapularis]|uniref:Uncharacterized protein n=1 Tax=Ixodes scapularis TaxID=6945 RepID=B7Q1Z9_IXOSC|nr:hypothetical protein IscW_ISCW020055 [Ixodes scapularis]|eukprot:XP_002410295.1 hypothetical protein IscW_ISCW020055 [Ixodes scapularis]